MYRSRVGVRIGVRVTVTVTVRYRIRVSNKIILILILILIFILILIRIGIRVKVIGVGVRIEVRVRVKLVPSDAQWDLRALGLFLVLALVLQILRSSSFCPPQRQSLNPQCLVSSSPSPWSAY